MELKNICKYIKNNYKQHKKTKTKQRKNKTKYP